MADLNISFSEIAILGGTFNPVHNGHIQIALYVLSKLSPDAVFLIPSGNPPHKEGKCCVSFIHRFNMVKLAADQHRNLIVSDIDNVPGEKSYTKNLIKSLWNRFPKTQLTYIIGEDNIPLLKTWYDYRWILDNVSIVAVKRALSGTYENVTYREKIRILDMCPVDISSEDIRERVAAGKDISPFVPERVKDYIIHHNLYRS